MSICYELVMSDGYNCAQCGHMSQNPYFMRRHCVFVLHAKALETQSAINSYQSFHKCFIFKIESFWTLFLFSCHLIKDFVAKTRFKILFLWSARMHLLLNYSKFTTPTYGTSTVVKLSHHSATIHHLSITAFGTVRNTSYTLLLYKFHL